MQIACCTCGDCNIKWHTTETHNALRSGEAPRHDHLCGHTCAHTCARTALHTHASTNTHKHKHTHTHTYTHTQTHTRHQDTIVCLFFVFFYKVKSWQCQISEIVILVPGRFVSIISQRHQIYEQKLQLSAWLVSQKRGYTSICIYVHVCITHVHLPKALICL